MLPLKGLSGCSILALSLLGPVACDYGDGRSHRYHDDVDPNDGLFCGDGEEAIIDTDEALDVDPGMGAGVFIEYESGGAYRVTTSCDADEGGPCSWDILVTPLDGASVRSLTPIDLESNDSVSLVQGSSARLIATTGNDFDGFTLETDPGAPIRFDALLDEWCANRYFFWMGDGALHGGAPSNPLDLFPSAE